MKAWIFNDQTEESCFYIPKEVSQCSHKISCRFFLPHQYNYIWKWIRITEIDILIWSKQNGIRFGLINVIENWFLLLVSWRFNYLVWCYPNLMKHIFWPMNSISQFVHDILHQNCMIDVLMHKSMDTISMQILKSLRLCLFLFMGMLVGQICAYLLLWTCGRFQILYWHFLWWVIPIGFEISDVGLLP